MSQDIIFEEISGVDGNIGLISLNRSKALNALSLEMIINMDRQLEKWARQDDIKAIVVKSLDERAFCAGGDIRLIYENGPGKVKESIPFFFNEYRLNRRIHHYPKPYIAFLDGITMGGGVGISLHGSTIIATDKLSFAMPETGIGFFPDVGGSYFLPRCPGKSGYYLGLTGARVNVADAFELGLVDHVIASENIDKIISTLAETPMNEDPDHTINTALNGFEVDAGTPSVHEHIEHINQYFAGDDIEDIINQLKHSEIDWCLQTAKLLEAKSPTSLKITLRQLLDGAKLDFDACMQMEFRLVNRILAGHDFYEGVRAQIIDKDRKPKWQPAHLDDIRTSDIEAYFANLEESELHFHSVH